ncbi:MAG TPA: heavy metal translocating P-type ATPase [Patescibacteria group bacterium]|nr:heavy metal translocating P-type ATPase [Patescibacteria group bacterium]
MDTKKIVIIMKAFQVPLLVLLGIPVYLFLQFLHLPLVAILIAILAMFLGSYDLVRETFSSLLKKQFALDYIAILAVVVAIITQQYVVGMVIALMSATGHKLEDYGASLAKESLTSLIDRLPQKAAVVKGDNTISVSLKDIVIGQKLLIRKGEVVGLDGKLISENALLDEASLTGEPYPVEKYEGDSIRSGVINSGNPFVIEVTKSLEDSTYSKIIELVKNAQEEKAPLIRIADQYSTYFTGITFIIAIAAFSHFHTLTSILAVLVVATPCPLILATPIALMGGVNAAAKKRVIVKKLASIESLAKINTLVFDKTGTITLGKPTVTAFSLEKKTIDEDLLLAIATAVERNSLHPLARAISTYAEKKTSKRVKVESIKEEIGKGISGVYNKKTYMLSKLPNDQDTMAIGIFEGKTLLGIFTCEDEMKKQSKDVIESLKNLGLHLFIFTGDKLSVAQKLVAQLGIPIEIKAQLSPDDKEKEVGKLKSKKMAVAMVGDGINDAPALARADVGIVFSNQEQTAATDAADVVILGGNFSVVLETVLGSKRTITIAKQSIFWGIGMSIAAMIFAAWGLIPPLYGAILQEGIDVVVIINALRAAK